MADQVQLQIRHPQRGGLGGHGVLPAQQDFDPGGHFIGGEGFGQVVVAASAQATHSLIDVGQGADHQDRRGHAHGPQGGDNRQAIELGQHAVEGDQVIVAADRALQPFAAIVDPVDVEAVATQFGDNLPGGHGVVFDGQDAGHKAGLIKCSQRCAAFCQEMIAGFLNKSSWTFRVSVNAPIPLNIPVRRKPLWERACSR
ncbi:hypothetical protein D3C87_1388940 [compost metagenome]